MKRNERTAFNQLKKTVTVDTINVEIPVTWTKEARQEIHNMLTTEKHFYAVCIYWNNIDDVYAVHYERATGLQANDTRRAQENQDIDEISDYLPRHDYTWTCHKKPAQEPAQEPTPKKTYAEKAREALNEYIERIEAGEELHVTVSHGNIKIGDVPSVSTLPGCGASCGGTCPSACRGTCEGDCYARKIANLRPSVLASYAKNTAIMLRDPDTYWADVADAVAASRFFRFHVSGDIFGTPYFEHMVNLAVKNPHCEILAFTKAYSTVNQWISKNGQLPRNLHILFSGWTNLAPVNPYNLPETNIIERGADVPETWKICGGNCLECGCRGLGCWQAQNGDVIAFHKH